jgi:hypothetical protein
MNLFSVIALLVIAGTAAGAAGPVTASLHALSREISRVRTEAQTTVPAEELAGVVVRLDRAAAAVDAGRLLVGLYELQPAFETQAAFAFAAASGVKTQEQFADKWKAVGEPRRAPADSRRRALFTEALAQSAEGKAPATYHASLPYAADSGLFGGLFYLGESQAFGRFAAFCRAVDLPPAGPAPVLRSLAPELSALEAQILDAYDKAEGTARQPFITISVTMKLAKSLDQEGRRPGALLQYLLTRYRFAATRHKPAAGDIGARIAAARAFAGDTDHSIAEFFLQLAETNAAVTDGAARAAAILDDVLPAYREVIK